MEFPKKQIFLTGFMGCGKSTYGKELSQLTQLPFYDLDTEIEAAEGKSIPQIFAENGEDYFRHAESVQLKKFTKQKGPFILATGGGTPCFLNNLQFMQENGLILYLKLSAEELHQRLTKQKTERPLIKSLTRKELLPYIHQTLQGRARFYTLADVVLAPADFTPEHFFHLFLNY